MPLNAVCAMMSKSTIRKTSRGSVLDSAPVGGAGGSVEKSVGEAKCLIMAE
jgi:hypothetical protein